MNSCNPGIRLFQCPDLQKMCRLYQLFKKFNCAALLDGTVKCSGNNWTGQLGDATFTMRLTPVQAIGVTNAVNVSVGANSVGLVSGF